MEFSRNNFYERVYYVVSKIPYGRVSTYGAIARYLGVKSSARLVGMALKNLRKYPNFYDLVPAHRVVNRNGFLTGKHSFSPPELMEELLKKEGIEIVNDKVVNFKELFWDPLVELGDYYEEI